MDVVPLLARLIAKDTHNPGGDEPALAQLLAEELKAHGPDELALVEVPRPGLRGGYVLARWGRPRLLVNAHLDTVPVNAGWTADPFQARVDDDRVMGLGAADTKGAIAAILVALGQSRPQDVAVLFSGDEERSGTCARAFLASPDAAGLTHAVVCEPTGCRPGIRHRGILALEARLAGKGGHSSCADSMPAPLASLARLAVAWHDWGRAQVVEGPPGYPGMCVNIAKLDGGVAFNVVPDEAVLCASFRPPPGSDGAAVRAELEAIARDVVPGVEVSSPLDQPPFQTRDLGAFRPWLGELVDGPVDLGFWTEAAVLAAHGIDAVVVGPGNIVQAHGPDEWVSRAQLDEAVAIFASLFARAREAR